MMARFKFAGCMVVAVLVLCSGAMAEDENAVYDLDTKVYLLDSRLIAPGEELSLVEFSESGTNYGAYRLYEDSGNVMVKERIYIGDVAGKAEYIEETIEPYFSKFVVDVSEGVGFATMEPVQHLRAREDGLYELHHVGGVDGAGGLKMDITLGELVLPNSRELNVKLESARIKERRPVKSIDLPVGVPVVNKRTIDGTFSVPVERWIGLVASSKKENGEVFFIVVRLRRVGEVVDEKRQQEQDAEDDHYVIQHQYSARFFHVRQGPDEKNIDIAAMFPLDKGTGKNTFSILRNDEVEKIISKLERDASQNIELISAPRVTTGIFGPPQADETLFKLILPNTTVKGPGSFGGGGPATENAAESKQDPASSDSPPPPTPESFGESLKWLDININPVLGEIMSDFVNESIAAGHAGKPAFIADVVAEPGDWVPEDAIAGVWLGVAAQSCTEQGVKMKLAYGVGNQTGRLGQSPVLKRVRIENSIFEYNTADFETVEQNYDESFVTWWRSEENGEYRILILDAEIVNSSGAARNHEVGSASGAE